MHRNISFVIAVILMLLAVQVKAEYVFLKDGSIIHGQITGDSTDAITIKDDKRELNTVLRKNIMRILYTDIYLGKIYVQKIDGKNEICYMVDEDRDTYTFRRELYKPEEFVLRRDQVLFIARGNPSGLEGEARTDSIALKWFPPYNPVKKYRIYIKGKDDKDFKLTAETGSKSYTLSKLKSNSKYVIYVTAIDTAGDESLPSNELTITTLNIKPDRPVKLRYEKRDSKVIKNGKKVKVTRRFIAWPPVKDIDGTISGYNVYYKTNGKEEKIATVKGTEYEIPEDKSVYDLRITAVDDRNDESPSSRIRHPRAVKIGVQPLYFMPLGVLSDMFAPGYGGLVYVSEKNFFMQNLEIGISGGAVMLPGADSDKIDAMLLAPVTLDCGYHFAITEFFSVMPAMSIGYTYMQIDYTAYNEERSKKSWEPFMRLGAMLNYEFEYLHLSAGGNYGFIFETSGLKQFVEVCIRAGVMIDL